MYGNLWPSPDGGPKRDRPGLLPTETVDVSAAITGSKDADYSGNPLKSIYCGGLGSVYIRRLDDAVGTWFEYAVPDGGYIYGLIVGVGGAAGHATTATKLRGER